MNPIASPYLFRATAIDVVDDPWITPGTHLRLFASPLLGAPVAPFVAWPLLHAHQMRDEIVDVRWVTEDGQVFLQGPIDTGQLGPVRGTVLGTNLEPRSNGWCYLAVEASDDLQVDWLAPTVRPWGLPVLGTRHGGRPYAFGGIGLGHMRISGRGEIHEVHGLNVDQISPEGFGEPVILSLPVQVSPWYANQGTTDPISEAQIRVNEGQRLRLGPPDSPDGSFPQPDDSNVDFRRIFDHLKPDQLDDWMKAAFMDIIPPGSVVHTIPGTDPNRRADAHVAPWDVILTMAADPVIARYLGLGAVVQPFHQDDGRPLFWLVAGQFAVSDMVADRLARAGILLERAGQESGVNSVVSSHLSSMFPLSSVRERIVAHFAPGGGRWEFVTLCTLAVAVARTPADPPPAPAVAPARSQWNGGAGHGTWRQTLALPGQPPAGSVGFARLEAGGAVSLHEQLPGFGAAALLANWSRTAPDPASQFNANLVGGAGGPLWTPPTVTDSRLPDDMDPGSWRLWQSDEFGRWSNETDLAASQPPRPVASAPAPELHFLPSIVAGDDPASPGTLGIRIDLPRPEALPPGARPISVVEIEVDGAPHDKAVGPGQSLVEILAPVGPTQPGGSRIVTVTARFKDTDGRVSLDGQAQREVFDPRPVLPAPTAPILVWAGRPDSTGLAELSISWPQANPQIGYRVYLGDERRLADALNIPDNVLHGTAENPPHRLHHTRALAADKICEADRARQLADKGQFTLLNETPVKPDGGLVRFQYRLPGGLRGVQLLRIVPVTPAGVEAPFGTCGLVPVAVPLEEQPPAPTIELQNEEGGVRVRVLAYGLSAHLLAQFGSPGSGNAPQFRLRRGRGGLQDPVYMPIMGVGDLTPPAAGAPPGSPWVGEFMEDAAGLPPFVRHTWIAEIRFPPEPVQAEALADPGPLAVRPLFGPFGQNSDSRWSAPSLPASTTRVPPDAPSAPATLIAEKLADGTVKLSVGGLPPGHLKAIAPFRLAVWKKIATNDGPRLTGEPPVIVAILPDQQVAEHIDAGGIAVGEAVAFSVALIDPLDRLGAAGEVDVMNL